MPVLFVAALQEESVALDDHVPVLHVGVGKVQAATSLAHQLAAHAKRIDLVVNVGTAGGLSGQRLGEVVEVGTVHQHDFDESGLSSLVGRDLPGGPIETAGPRGARARLATGDRFVLDGQDRARLARDADVVDMEGYAIAAVCQRFGVPVWLTKAVADDADGGAAVSWRGALDLCSRRLAAWAAGRGLI